MSVYRLTLCLALTGCVDSVGFPAAEDTDGFFLEGELFDEQDLELCTVDAREPNDGDDDYTTLGLIHPDRPVVMCGRVDSSGTSDGQYTGDHEVALLQLLERRRLTFELHWDSSANIDMYLWRGDIEDFEAAQTFSMPEIMSADIGAGYHWLTVVGDSGGSANYDVVITAY